MTEWVCILIKSAPIVGRTLGRSFTSLSHMQLRSVAVEHGMRRKFFCYSSPIDISLGDFWLLSEFKSVRHFMSSTGEECEARERSEKGNKRHPKSKKKKSMNILLKYGHKYLEQTVVKIVNVTFWPAELVFRSFGRLRAIYGFCDRGPPKSTLRWSRSRSAMFIERRLTLQDYDPCLLNKLHLLPRN